MSLTKCCSCMLFDWECLKRKAMFPAYMLETDPVLQFAVETTHTEHIKPLIGKDCYNALCLKARQEASAMPYDPDNVYGLDEVVLYNEGYYISLIVANTAPLNNPLAWAVAGFTDVDNALIAMLLPYAALLVDYYYRIRRAGGDINPSGIQVNTPDNTQTPQLGAAVNLNKVNFELAQKKEAAILDFLGENAANYPCFVPKPCQNTCSNAPKFISPFLNFR